MFKRGQVEHDHGQFEIKTFPIYALPYMNRTSIISNLYNSFT